MDVPIEILDRDVARAAGALAAARAEPGARNPLAAHRRVSSRATWMDLADAPGPLAAPLRDWVAALTLERVLWDDAVRVEEAWRAPTITVAETQIASFTESPRDLLVRMLREADPARRRIFAGALERGARPAHDAARRLSDRRVEAGRLLGADVVALEIPVDPPASLTSLAARLLTETAPFLERAGSWSEALSQSVAREAGEGWPARLNSRWLVDLFHGSPLTEGIRPALPPLPAAIGASSFARALGAFGAALAVAGAMPGPTGARSGPSPFFAMAWSPYDLRPRRRAALFAALTADPVFARRALGLGQGRAEDQARVVARALCISLRLDAARVLLRGALSLPDGDREACFEEHTAAALGAPIPPVLGGLVPRLGPDDPSRFAGALLAAADRRRLVERFDEDWFRSPHAGHALREEDASPRASPLVPAASLEAGLGEIVRTLGAL